MKLNEINMNVESIGRCRILSLIIIILFIGVHFIPETTFAGPETRGLGPQIEPHNFVIEPTTSRPIELLASHGNAPVRQGKEIASARGSRGKRVKKVRSPRAKLVVKQRAKKTRALTDPTPRKPTVVRVSRTSI